jgi:hypothetical protein
MARPRDPPRIIQRLMKLFELRSGDRIHDFGTVAQAPASTGLSGVKSFGEAAVIELFDNAFIGE